MRTKARVLVPRSIALAAALPGLAVAQTSELTFSLDFQGPSMGVQTIGGPRITDADLLISTGSPFAPGAPEIAVPGSFLQAYNLCQGHLPGIACGLELNALSFGRDTRIRPDATYEFRVYLSVDEFATGVAPPAGTRFPTVFTEAQEQEAAADVFLTRFVGAGPYLPIQGNSVATADGDGGGATPGLDLVHGLGLPEPIPPTPDVPDFGDNLDALNVGRPFDPATDRIYFSLQGGFPICGESNAPTFDAAGVQPVLGSPTNASSADVLVFRPGVGVGAYASAQELGLDTFGPGTDDIDGLAVVDDGDGFYFPPATFYDWADTSPTDLILFSLRCGSAALGQVDPITGLVLTEGDILVTLAGSSVPTVFVPAESLGLNTVSRGGIVDDELDGFSLDGGEGPWDDCNGNGVEDTMDILLGDKIDDDGNGIPDICEKPGGSFCDCGSVSNAPCGNTGSTDSGCGNATGVGAKMAGVGTSSLAGDSLTLQLTDLPPLAFGLVFMSDSTTDTALGNGRRCVGGATGLFRLPIFQADIGGAHSEGPGLVATSSTLIPAPTVTVGSTFGFQAWYRDSLPSMVGGPCGTGSNLTNGWLVTFTP
ncbi:MAG: hypothetical protein AAFU73_12335 [Planctomycetota bacterium]